MYELYKKFHGNLSRVSAEPGAPSMQTLIRWKKEEGWQVALAENQSQLREFASLLTKSSGLPELENDIHQLKILDCLERYCGEAIREGSIQPQDWKDILDTLRFVSTERKLLTGKPTGRTETLHSVTPENRHELYKLVEEAQRIIRKYGQQITPPAVGTDAGQGDCRQ
jgi:hypothetical protein